MNSKLIKGSLAGVAVVALAAGSTTFAAWSDWDTVTGNETEAGHLKIDLNSTGSINNVGGQAIAPGEFRTIDFMIASADLDGVPAAGLTMRMLNLVDQENGCGSTSSEAAVDNCASGNPGEFSGQGYMRIRYTNPSTSAVLVGNDCSAPSGYVNAFGYSPPSNNNDTAFPRVAAVRDAGAIPLGTLSDGEAVCVRVDIGLGDAATDAVQSDSSMFDLEFRLDQVL